MNCDQVFGVLTRGPFPQGELEDKLVEAHLAVCPSCWRFAEALRPAVDVFEEAIPAAESRLLPVYGARSMTPAEALHVTRKTASTRSEYALPITSRAIRPSNQAASQQSMKAVDTSRSWYEIGRAVLFFSLIAIAAFAAGWLLG